jgi:hypothetical protein
LLPIVAVIGAFAIAIVAMVLKSHARERQHRERMFMAEKGLEIPQELYELPEAKEPKRNGFRAGRAWLMIFGAILIFVGIGVMIALGVQRGMHEGINGIIPLLIGIGFLVSERMIARSVAKQDHE